MNKRSGGGGQTTGLDNEQPLPPRDIEQILAAVARPIILTQYKADSCIGSTRIAIEALRYFGIDAFPYAVKVMTYNAVFADRIEKQLPPLDDPEAWSVGIGYNEPDPGNILGHVIAVTASYIVDLSIDQASRPAHGITHQPVALYRPPTFPDEATWYTNDDEGSVLIYDPMPGHQPWKGSTNWTASYNRRLSGAVIRAIQHELRETT